MTDQGSSRVSTNRARRLRAAAGAAAAVEPEPVTGRGPGGASLTRGIRTVSLAA
jgi:hypothetical protein